MASIAPQWLELWDAYEAGDSEAIFVKCMDSLDMAAQAIATTAKGGSTARPCGPAERRLAGTQWSTDLRRGRCRPHESRSVEVHHLGFWFRGPRFESGRTTRPERTMMNGGPSPLYGD